MSTGRPPRVRRGADGSAPPADTRLTDHYLDVEDDFRMLLCVLHRTRAHTIPQPLPDQHEILQLARLPEAGKLEMAKRANSWISAFAAKHHGLTEKNNSQVRMKACST